MFAGTGAKDQRDGHRLSAAFEYITGIAIDENDRVFVADRKAIRMIANGNQSEE